MITLPMAVCAVAMVATIVAQSATPAAEAATQAQAATAPEIRRHGGVAYISSGADAARRAEAIRLGSDMNLLLMFTHGSGGEPLSDVAVSVTDSHGETVLDLASADALLRTLDRVTSQHGAATPAGARECRLPTCGPVARAPASGSLERP